MSPTLRAPLRDDERRNLYDPELMLEWGTYDSAYCKQTFTLAKMDRNGFAVFGLVPVKVVEASAISDLLCGRWTSRAACGRVHRPGCSSTNASFQRLHFLVSCFSCDFRFCNHLAEAVTVAAGP